MGTKFIESGADYSAVSLGHAGLYTSIVAGLKSLHELRRNASKTRNNSAPSGAEAAIVGSPVFAATSLQVSAANRVSFAAPPVSGNSSQAIIVKIKTGGTGADIVVGVVGESPTVNGAAYITNENLRVRIDTVTFPSGSVPPYTGYGTLAASIDFLAASNGLFEMLIATVENNVALRLYHPKKGNLVTLSAVGRDFLFNTAMPVQAGAAGAGPNDAALFAYWNRTLSTAEMNTFYAEMKPQYAQLGLEI